MEDSQPAERSSELFVDPIAGADDGIGDRSQPFKTLLQALQQAAPGTIVYLQPGRYDAAGGERFPIVIPPGVAVVGNVPARGGDTAIVGGNDWESAIFGQQNVALVLSEGSQVRGVTVTNSHARGTGIWVEDVAATIAHCRLGHCEREGVFVTGTATPTIFNCWFLQNQASGITFTRYGKGEIQRSLFRQNRFGLTLSDFAAPLIHQSEITENQVGLVLSGVSRPVLRELRIAANAGEGLVVFQQAVPDLGDRQSPGSNYFQDNGDAAIRNLGSRSITAAGNFLHPHAVRGAIELRALQPVQTGGWEPELAAAVRQPQSNFAERNLPNLPPDLVHHWSLPFVSSLLNRRIMGCFADGTFQPDRPVLRAQFAAIVVRAFERPSRFADRRFCDVPADYWAAAAIAQAAQMGFVEREVEREADALFYPDQPLSRWQAICWLVHGLELRGGTPDLLQAFRDRAEIPSIALAAVAAAVAHQLLILPQPDRLAPLLPVTRSEIAAWIDRALLEATNGSTAELLQQNREQNSAELLHLGHDSRLVARPADGNAPLVAIDFVMDQDLDSQPAKVTEPATATNDQAEFWIAAQVAERLEQTGIPAKLIQTWEHPIDWDERLVRLKQIQPALLLRLHLVTVSTAAITTDEMQTVGVRTQYAPPESQPLAVLLHRALLESLDLPDRKISPLSELPYPLTVPTLTLELRLLAESISHPEGIDRSFCTYLAATIQQGLLQVLAV